MCGPAIIASVDLFLRSARAKQNQIIACIRELVECESPTDDAAGIHRFGKLFDRMVSDIGRVRRYSGE